MDNDRRAVRTTTTTTTTSTGVGWERGLCTNAKGIELWAQYWQHHPTSRNVRHPNGSNIFVSASIGLWIPRVRFDFSVCRFLPHELRYARATGVEFYSQLLGLCMSSRLLLLSNNHLPLPPRLVVSYGDIASEHVSMEWVMRCDMVGRWYWPTKWIEWSRQFGRGRKERIVAQRSGILWMGCASILNNCSATQYNRERMNMNSWIGGQHSRLEIWLATVQCLFSIQCEQPRI